MNRIMTKMFVSLAAVFVMMLSALAIPAPASAETVDVSDKITTETGPIDILGGGDHFFVRFGNDAAFGIVWGTDDVENNVYFVAIKARYLGFAQVYDRNGEMLAENHTVKIYTIYAVKLDNLLEFNDVNDDGTLPYYRLFDRETGEYTSYVSTEPMYKKVDLKTSWNATDVIETTDAEKRTWTFGLTANDEPYSQLDVGAEPVVGDNRVNNLTLTFNLEASLVQVDNASMPQWRITVQTGALAGWTYMTAERLENMAVSGKLMSYDVKWDQLIEGWDYDPANTNPMLMMEFQAITMNGFPNAWMNALMLRHMNAVGVMNCESAEGDTLEVNDSTERLPLAERIKTRLTFGTDWTSIGALTWVDDVTVDGEPELVRAQIMAAYMVASTGTVAGHFMNFVGFVALGGLIFPGGDLIVHDPTFTSEALVDVSTDGSTGLPIMLIGLAAAIIVIIVVAVVVVASDGKKPGKGVQNSFEKSKGSQSSDWAKYYNKK